MYMASLSRKGCKVRGPLWEDCRKARLLPRSLTKVAGNGQNLPNLQPGAKLLQAWRDGHAWLVAGCKGVRENVDANRSLLNGIAMKEDFEDAMVEPILRPGNVVLDSSDPPRLAAFWQALTGYVPRGLFEPYLGLVDPSGIGVNITVQRVDAGSPSSGPTRCHIDFYVTDPEGAALRAQELGAKILRRVSEGDVNWVVLCDPDGNEFCLVAALGPDRNR